MLISKEQCKNHVADQSDDREVIGKISFEKSGAVSTDGKRVLIVPYPVYSDNDLFETEESKADSKYKLKKNEAILIDADTAKHLSVNFFKEKEQTNHVGRLAAIDVKKDIVLISMVSDTIGKEFEIKKSGQKFPDWRTIIPKSKVTGTTLFGIDLLLDTLKKIKSSITDDATNIEFRFHGDIGVVELTTVGNCQHKEIKALIMPMRDKE